MEASPWRAWASARPAGEVLHLDTAAAGRSSYATLGGVAAHARREAEVGGYVAAEEAAETLSQARRDAALVLGGWPQEVAFVESGTAALQRLVEVWPLAMGARVAVAPGEWGTNLDLLRHEGLTIVTLPVDGCGVVDPEALGRQLAADPPAVVLVDHVAAHRGLVQPVEAIIASCRAAGVPVWLDAAQSAGHLRVPAGADAVFATSRKWIGGPRGVGLLAIASEHHERLRAVRLGKRPGAAPMELLEPDEAHIAGRVGLGIALSEVLALGLDAVSERLVEVGRLVREAIAEVPGWEVAAPGGPAAAITGLVPTAGADVVATRERLLHEHRILTTAGLPWRAPLETADDGVPGPWLRISPHVDLDSAAVERLCAALAG